MKSSILSRLVAASAFVAASTTALVAQNTYDRVVLIEQFTSATCGPCVAAGPVLKQATVLANNVISVRYHMDFPAPGDPWNVDNPTENAARQSFYGVNSIPTARVDGINVENPRPEGQIHLQTSINNDKAAKSPAYIKVWQEGEKVKVSLNSNIALNRHRLHVVMVNRNTQIPSLPQTLPGSNGETEWDDAMVDLLTVPGGQAITGIAANGSKTYEFTSTLGLGAVWPAGQQYAIAFVQDSVTKEIIQAGVMRNAADSTKYAFLKPTSVTASVNGTPYTRMERGATITREVTLTNTGSTSVTATLNVADIDALNSAQVGWNVSMEPQSVTLAAGENKKITVTIKAPANRSIYSQFSMSFTGTDGIGKEIAPFAILVNGAKIAVYAGLDGSSSAAWTQAALGAIPTYANDAVLIPYSTDANAAFPYTDFDLTVYNIDFAGRGAFRGALLQQITGALNAGKKVWVASEVEGTLNLDNDQNQNADPEAKDFFNNTMGMTPVGSIGFVNQGNLSQITVRPVAGDPIGGTAADSIHVNYLVAEHGLYYQQYMDVFVPKTGASAQVTHTIPVNVNNVLTNAAVAFRYSRDNGARLFWSAIGNQAMAAPAEHVAYTKRATDWLMNASTSAPAITSNRTSVNFGQVPTTKTVDETITLTNSGNAPLIITSINISGKNPEAFSIIEGGTSSGSITVPAKATHVVKVRFSPSTAAAYSANLAFASNAPANPTIALSGNGTVTGVSDDVSETGAIGLRVVGANPVVDASSIELRSVGNITLTVVNSNGAVVSTLFKGNVDGTERIAIDAATLPSGAYTLVASNGVESAAVSIVVTR